MPQTNDAVLENTWSSQEELAARAILSAKLLILSPAILVTELDWVKKIDKWEAFLKSLRIQRATGRGLGISYERNNSDPTVDLPELDFDVPVTVSRTDRILSQLGLKKIGAPATLPVYKPQPDTDKEFIEDVEEVLELARNVRSLIKARSDIADKALEACGSKSDSFKYAKKHDIKYVGSGPKKVATGGSFQDVLAYIAKLDTNEDELDNAIKEYHWKKEPLRLALKKVSGKHTKAGFSISYELLSVVDDLAGPTAAKFRAQELDQAVRDFFRDLDSGRGPSEIEIAYKGLRELLSPWSTQLP